MNKLEILEKYKINLATLKNWIKSGLDINIDSPKIDVNIIEQFIIDNNKLTTRNNKSKTNKKIIPKELIKILNIEILNKILLVIDDAFDNNLNSDSIIDTLLIKRIDFILQQHFNNEQYIDLLLNIKRNLNLNQELYNNLSIEDNPYFFGVVIQYVLGINKQSNLGSYYTPIDMIQKIIPNDVLNKTFLDPCSGSGFILFELFKKIKNDTQENPLKFIFGNDINSKSVISSIIELSYMAKDYKEFIKPNISNIDGLSIDNLKVDYILTNPPYGAKIDNKLLENKLSSKESFSFFIYKSLFSYLNENGKLFFILPDSILKVKSHKNIRKYLLDNGLYKIEFLGKKFHGVLSDIVIIFLDKNKENSTIEFIDKDTKISISKNIILKNKELNINKFQTLNNEVKIQNYLKQPHFFLNENDFYLGIVTGNNNKNISNIKTTDFNEEIILGKNFDNNSKYFININNKFQQTPPLEVFKRNKIIYKFISSKIKTKVDFEGKYTINSINIYSPLNMSSEQLKNISKQLNSNVSQFFLNFYFGNTIKILKEHLISIPIFLNK